MKIEKFDAYKTEYIYNYITGKCEKVNGITFILNNKRYFYDKTKQVLREIKISREKKEFIKKCDTAIKKLEPFCYINS